MPKFSDRPPVTRRCYTLPLVRTPSGRPLIAVVTSERLLGINTHFYGGRTIPCEDNECDACREGMPFRWHGYLGAYDWFRSRQFIFEVTAAGADQLLIYYQAMGTLRGCAFQATRRTRSPNSKVQIETKPADLSKIHMPEQPDIIKCLATIWQIPTAAFEQIDHRDQQPEFQIDSDVKKNVGHKQIAHTKNGDSKCTD